jgi:hypothetical protein
MRCPHCQQDVEPTPIKFSWWGGVLGPRLLNHVACPGCAGRFNGKSGQSNTTAITIYMIVVGVVALMLGFALTHR